MPRNVNGQYSKAAGTTAEPNTTITSAQFNSTVDDIVDDLNAARPITAGGTGATSEENARTNLDVAQKQSAVTDATPGRGLIVGGFGIGSSGVSPGATLNLALHTGVYNVLAGTEGTPDTTGPTGSTCIVTRFSSTNVQQIFIRRGNTSADVRLYVRHMRDGVWGGWSVVYTATNLLGTVSQSSGAPTGGVIERVGTTGSGNGAYVRFADGTQICTATGRGFSVNNTGGGVDALTYEWTFPAAFAATPVCAVILPSTGVGTYQGINPVDIGHVFQTTGTTSIVLGLRRSFGAPSFGSIDGVVGCSLTATGVWFA